MSVTLTGIVLVLCIAHIVFDFVPIYIVVTLLHWRNADDAMFVTTGNDMLVNA